MERELKKSKNTQKHPKFAMFFCNKRFSFLCV
jgi:hypothetical protein